MGGLGPWSQRPLSRRTESRWGPCLYSNHESKPWNILGKGQIWEHPHNDHVFHWEIAFTFYDISIDFSFPHEDVQVFQSLTSPQDIFPPDFSESSINSLLTGILQADQVTDRHRMFVVKWPFPFARLGAIFMENFLLFGSEETYLLPSLWDSTAMKGWKQWFSILAWHQ